MHEARTVVVAGGGVIGWAIARVLAQRGIAACIVDDGTRAGIASRAAAGMLSPLAETTDGGALHALADASLDLFPAFVAALERESGIDVEYRTNGKLHVAFSAGEAGDLERLARSAAAERHGVELLDGADARVLEPALGEAVLRALLVRRDHRIDSRRMHEALRAAGQAAGARARVGRVVACDTRDDAIVAVRLADGERIACSTLVLAAGAWSAEIAGIAAPPVRPVRGQMLAVHAPQPLFRRVVASPRCYLIPRASGRLLVGATVEELGFAEGTTPEGMAVLRAAAAEVAPVIAALPVVERWFGFRPGTPDALPVLGPDDRVRGLLHATGHYRNGILLTPVTAACIAALVLGERPPVPLEPFSVRRFR